MTEWLIAADELRATVARNKHARDADAEFAILDVREEADFAEGHLLLASNVPLSRLELLVERLVPRLTTRVILCDGGEALAARARAVLVRMGYSELAVLDGGVSAAVRVGFRLFSGINVPSKAFGEYVETVAGTPHIGPLDLKACLDRGDDVVLIDSRPPEEFYQMNIPGARNLPGAEIVYRVHELVSSEETTIVVNCAGRTRSIIGAQSLRNAGVPNRVFALRNGTMGWHLAGLPLGRGERSELPDVRRTGLAAAQRAAARVAQRFGVRRIDQAVLNGWRAEVMHRNLFILDVRTREEYEAGHLRDARWAPGGQLVQETDRYIGVRNSRIVLVDDTGVRATMSASWLQQMGWRDVVVLDGGLDGEPLVTGDHSAATPPVRGVPELDAGSLQRLLESHSVVVVDLALSSSYTAGHIPGARFAIRSRLSELVRELTAAEIVVLTSEDGLLAQLAQPELAAQLEIRVLVLAGGTAAWQQMGLPLEGGWHGDQAPGDVWIEPYDYGTPDEIERQMRRYLEWEIALTDEVRVDGSLDFDVGGAVGIATPTAETTRER